MNKYKKLINNSIVFTIGTFGSKLISLLMVPLYTHLLTTNEYGTIDVLNTTVSLLIPFITLELGQAALRFSIDQKNEISRNKIFSTIFFNSLLIAVVLVLLTPVIVYLDFFGEYDHLFLVLLLFSSFNALFSQYLRGVGLIKEFAINGIIMTFVTVLSNIFLLVYLGLKVEGYLLSLIIASLVSNLYIFYSCKGFSKIRTLSFDAKLIKEMVKYSMPIIPNSSMWWIINGSTRYFILYFVGATGNGLFAVANKIPTLISTVTGIFSQAWQISSFEEYESEDKSIFYSRVFNFYSVFLFIAGSGIIFILRPLLSFIVDDSFYESWKIVPPLVIGVIYQSFSTFLGTNYTAAKQTKGAFSTSVYGGIISIISSVVFVPFFGAVGAGISTCLSFVAMFVIRFIDTKKYVNISLNKKTFYMSNAIIIIQSVILYLNNSSQIIIIEFVLFLLLLFLNRSELSNLMKNVIDTIGRKRK